MIEFNIINCWKFYYLCCCFISEGSTSTLPAEKSSPNSPQKRYSAIQANVQSENAQVEVKIATTVENSYFGQILSNSLILLCYESELSIHTLNFVFEVLHFTPIFLQISICSFLLVNEIS